VNNDILINRKIMAWGWYKDANTMRVFLHLLLNANWHDGEYRGKPILRGQCLFGRKAFAEDLGISEQSIRTSINHLISTNEITIKSTNKFSVITIVKYNDYQLSSLINSQENNQQINMPSTNNQPTTNHIQFSKSSNSLNQGITNMSPTPEKRTAKSIPPTVEEISAYCEKRKNGVDPQHFFDFYQSKGWIVGKTKMKDWEAAVRTWEQKSKAPQQYSKDFFGD